MSEFDFEELDRAVTSALGRSTNDTVPARSSDPSTASEPVQRGQVAPRMSVPARRASGRFMDVVHPSSDMKSSDSTSASSPSSPAPMSVTSEPAFVAPEPEPAPAPQAMTMEPSSQPETTPLESPFIETEVQKRPLGGSSSSDSNTATLSDADAVTSAAQASKSRWSQQTPLPKELSDEVLALDDVPAVQDEDPSEPPLVSAPMPFTPSPTHPAAKASVPTPGIYDTESYHAPTVKPAKKKTGLFITLWILSLIIIGAGVGALVYFYVLPLI